METASRAVNSRRPSNSGAAVPTRERVPRAGRIRKPELMPKARRDAAALRTLEREAAGCRRCSLWARATQTVFGSGAPKATFVFVGEQPGDVEDQAGEPFVGPAGQLLRSCIEEAGLDIDDIYLTNAVKHFKWRPQGKRRLHERPNREEILACRMW